MKNKAALKERIQLMAAAGLLTEAVEVGGSDTIEEFEFELNGKHYMATLDVNYQMDYSPQDGDYDNYRQQVEVRDLGIDQVGDYQEYVPVGDSELIKKVQDLFNTDPAFSERIEDLVDTWDAEESYEDADEYFDDLEEDSDYKMGTPSGDTDAMGDTAVMGNIAENMYGNSFKDIGQVIDLLAFLGDYMEDRADSDDESDESGRYSMNQESQFSSQIDDAIEYLQGLNKKPTDIKGAISEDEGSVGGDQEQGDTIISRGEKIAMARGLDLLTNEQMIGLYLKALEKYENEPGKYLNMVPKLANWGSRDNEGRFIISASRLGKALGVESPNTSIRTVNKYVNILKGEGDREDEALYPKILKAAEKLKRRNPRDLATIVDNAIADTAAPAMQKRGRPGLPSDLGRRVDVVVKGLVNQAGFEWDRAKKSAISKIAKEVGADESKVAAAYQEYDRLNRK